MYRARFVGGPLDGRVLELRILTSTAQTPEGDRYVIQPGGPDESGAYVYRSYGERSAPKAEGSDGRIEVASDPEAA